MPRTVRNVHRSPQQVRAVGVARYPQIKPIFYETLPPGIEALQIARGSLEIGNLIVDVRPVTDCSSVSV